MTATTQLRVTDLTIGYGNKVVREKINFQLMPQQICCLLGNNGCGKTTLIKTLLKILPPLKGSIRIGAREVSQLAAVQLAKHMAYVPQAHNFLFPFLVQDIVLMGRNPHLRWFTQPSQKDCQLANEILEQLNIAHLKRRYYTEISGGERQLVLIARALCQQPQVLLMDEPSSNLDFGNQLKLIEQIQHLKKSNITVLLSLHNPKMAREIADNVILFMPEEVLFGSAQQYLNMENIAAMYQVKPELVTRYIFN